MTKLWQPSGPGTFGIPSKVPNIGEFYADYDNESSMWCVFHTETDEVIYQCCDREETANALAEEYNKSKRSTS